MDVDHTRNDPTSRSVDDTGPARNREVGAQRYDPTLSSYNGCVRYRGPGPIDEGGTGNGERRLAVPGGVGAAEAYGGGDGDPVRSRPVGSQDRDPHRTVTVSAMDFLPLLHVVERLGIEEPSSQHHEPDAVAVTDILQRIPVEDLEIGHLAGLERAEILAQSHGLGADDGGGPKDLVRRHPAQPERPELPVDAQALHVAMGAHPDPPTRGSDRGSRSRDVRKSPLLLLDPLAYPGPDPFDLRLR